MCIRDRDWAEPLTLTVNARHKQDAYCSTCGSGVVLPQRSRTCNCQLHTRIQPVVLGARLSFTLPNFMLRPHSPLHPSLLHHYLRPFPFHIPFIYALLPSLLFLLLPCPYDPRNHAWKNAIRFLAAAGLNGVGPPNVPLCTSVKMPKNPILLMSDSNRY